ncbi:MAG: helix-turn-helix transcriptional regulator [Oscillospiraceae bacterium]|nr:helix-turn-helix transcriptional regulator [Oscillospiraceae bacterium]
MRDDFRERYRVLGLRIAFYRKLRGMTQEQFAEAIGRSVSFVSQIEANNAPAAKGVSLETLFTMSETLGIPVSRLFEDGRA